MEIRILLLLIIIIVIIVGCIIFLGSRWRLDRGCRRVTVVPQPPMVNVRRYLVHVNTGTGCARYDLPEKRNPKGYVYFPESFVGRNSVRP